MGFEIEKKAVIERALDDDITFDLAAVNAQGNDNILDIMNFSNVLNVSASPSDLLYGDYFTNKYNNFSDLGAWHGYYLPEKDANNYVEVGK